MQQFKEALKILEKSQEFKEWKKNNPQDHLSYGMFIVEDKEREWKIGYCNKENQLTSFNIGKKITIEPDEEALQKKKQKILGLDKEKLKLDLAEAVAIANDTQKEEFATETPTKIVAIVQKLDIGQIWNITFLTQSFNTLNFKIDSSNGNVIEKKISPLFQMQK